MNKKTIYTIIGLAVILGGYGLSTLYMQNEYNGAHESVDAESGLYTCGMHPEVVHEGPGNCPICDMVLTPIRTFQAATMTTQNTEQERKIKYWVAPMDPNYISDKPGKSPMGMDLVPVYEDGMGGSESVITIDPTVVQNMGILTTPVEVRSLGKEIRTIGLVDYDETRFTHVHTKVKGWIESLYIDYTGQRVYKGEPLLDIYSPELVSTQEEYLTVLANKNSNSTGATALLRSTRERLANWDITPKQIEELERTLKVNKVMTIYSPFNGIVVEKMATKGMNVTEGMTLYAIADLAKVWVYADIYEYELPWLEDGLEAEMTLSYIPGKVFKGTVAFVYPFLDSKTRTIKVRLEFDNKDGKLKPGMYANILIKTAKREKTIVVPRESVIHSGERELVFVEVGKGKYDPREITLGVQGEGGYYEVISGLRSGERVVTSGQFMLDSESSLREAVLKRLRARERNKNTMEMN